MIIKVYKTLTILLFIFLCQNTFADRLPLIVLQDCNKSLKIENQVGIYEAINDPDFSPFRASSEEKFKLNKEQEIHLHYKNEAGFWIKFRVKNKCKSNNRFFLEINNPTINRLNFYNASNSLSPIETGDVSHFASRVLDFRVFVFELNIPYEEEQTFYMYVNTEGDQVGVPISIWHPASYSEKVYKEQIIGGVFYGILLLIIILHFFFYFNLKDITHIYYVLYVTFIGTLLLSLDGLFFQYLMPGSPWISDRMLVLSAFACTFFLVIFTQNYLDTKNQASGFHKVLNGAKVIALILTILALAPHKIYVNIIQVVSIFDPLINFLVIATAIASYKKNRKLTTYFIIAFGILIVGVLIIILKVNGLLVGFPLRDYGFKIGVVGEIMVLSFALTVRFKMMQEETQALALDRLEKLNQFKDEQNVQLEKMVKERTIEIHEQKEIIEKKNIKITDSIRYARRIQDSILPSTEQILKYFPESFVLYKPKDIVSGDFYWFAPLETQAIIAVVDCTGHGVPGAFMSMLGSSLLNQIVNIHHITQPDRILTMLNIGVKNALKQNDSSSESRDGMDVSLCTIDYVTGKVQFSGAKRPLYVVSKEGELNILKGNQCPIGGSQIKQEECFENNILNLNKGDALYMFTDGYIDQFGGTNDTKFMTKNFKDLLLKVHHKDINTQLKELDDCIEDWKGNTPQTDDILVIGVKV